MPVLSCRKWGPPCFPFTDSVSQMGIVLLLLIMSTILASGGDGNEDDQNVIYRQESDMLDDTADFALKRLEKIIRIYNFTESIEEKYMKLRAMDPYGEASRAVSTVTEKLKAQHYDDVRKLLARELTREPGKRIFDNLYHQSKALDAEFDQVTELVNVVKARGRTKISEEALKLQDSLKTDLRNITKDLKNELVMSAIELMEQNLYPRSAEDFDEGERFVNVFPKVDREALDGLCNLFQRAGDLGDKIADAFLQDEDDESESVPMESVVALDEQLDNILDKQIPAFIAQHNRALSRVPLITKFRLDEFETRIKKLDVEAALLNAQDKVMEKAFESMTAEHKSFTRAKEGAEKIYKKYYDWEALLNSEPPPTPVLAPAAGPVFEHNEL